MVSYRAGYLHSTSGGPDAVVYVIQLNGPWTQPQIDAYLDFEGVADGQDVTTPKGHVGKRKVGAFEVPGRIIRLADGAVVEDSGAGTETRPTTGANTRP